MKIVFLTLFILFSTNAVHAETSEQLRMLIETEITIINSIVTQLKTTTCKDLTLNCSEVRVLTESLVAHRDSLELLEEHALKAPGQSSLSKAYGKFIKKVNDFLARFYAKNDKPIENKPSPNQNTRVR
ncbi:MAG: hypothetical protein SGI74_14530 [Oligoflexia bacterium]|nr:hypothetical protein [Oligoflexia bacterium]